jgi:hypothetical protein
MDDRVIVDSSFSVVINGAIEKITIPVWCFGLPAERERNCDRERGR